MNSNLSLLNMYYAIIGDGTSEEYVEVKVLLQERVKIRENIKIELKDYLEKIKEHNRHFVFALAPFIKTEYLLTAALRKATWGNCEDCELSNVSLYYDCLYKNTKNKDFIDLLLRQKGKIENYLIAQM
ncbi:hypothetical protein RM549_17305 [Salegentibacter sp. F188]|uniref:Uncharacterized protein n=1 Tax=Autumnicola patrickiae TaxID=3075591 RepID=A0ABU3E6C4_9FLAO|nr:hypothetical protein [Salegentibacter sp. F188]MDT0691552.1 hypothetical protein [Salegentibacter sp. F188]